MRRIILLGMLPSENGLTNSIRRGVRDDSRDTASAAKHEVPRPIWEGKLWLQKQP